MSVLCWLCWPLAGLIVALLIGAVCRRADAAEKEGWR